MTNAYQLFRNSRMFEGAPDELIQRLLATAQSASFAPGDVPVAEATVTGRILMILEGDVQISAELHGGQAVDVFQAGPGTFLGLVNFFATVSQPYSATANSTLQVLAWDAQDWRELCDADPAFGCRLSQRVGRELVERMSNWITEIFNNVSWGM